MNKASSAPEETGVLQMIRADVNVHEFQRWMGAKRLQTGHAMHCLLKEFSDNGPKPFGLIVPRGNSFSVFLRYARLRRGSARNRSVSPTLCSAGNSCRQIDSKLIPRMEAGRLLGFETRIRPIVRQSRNNPSKPTRECDAFQAEAEQHLKGGMERGREEVYRDWLSSQLDRIGGASLDVKQTKLVSFQRTRAVRKLHGHYSEGPDAVMRGNLTITDPAAFSALLARGVGRHRAYGYGMLLLRPAGT